MKILLDTNIIIHRERIQPTERNIGKLFYWLDKLGYKKFVHPVTIAEIQKMQNAKRLEAFTIKLESYNLFPTTSKLAPDVEKMSKVYDRNENDINDTVLLNEVFLGHFDMFITEDRKIHRKADELGIDVKVFTIEGFLEKATSENPDLLDYKVLAIKRENFSNVDVSEEFFNTFREDYKGFDKWFAGKADETVYVCRIDEKIVAFLYLKIENENEPYPDIHPTFEKGKRLKIGTFKVELNGFKLGERFLKIIFDNAFSQRVKEIYVTIFPKRPEQEMLISLLKDYGFTHHGVKRSSSGEESVFTRQCDPSVDLSDPKKTYPYLSSKASKYIVSIYPEYHTDLFPDSILRTESPLDFAENEPYRNAISKVFISRSLNRDLKSGDIITFYRTGGYYTSVVTTLGIVESVHTQIRDFRQFVDLCRKRTVFSDAQLEMHWNYKPTSRPFVVNFLYAYSFPVRVNMKRLIEIGVIKDIGSAPRGFEKLTDDQFQAILKETRSNENLIVN